MSESQTTFPKVNYVFYEFLRHALYIGYLLFFRIRCYGLENLPSKGDTRGLIIAPNHASFLDPPIFGAVQARHITYLAKDYLFKAFFVGWVLRNVGALPIKSKEDDFRSIRTLTRLLKAGKALVVFPEGTRSENGQLKAAEAGVGFLAIKSEAYVLPVYIHGSYEAYPKGAKFFRLKPIRVYFGKPFVATEEGLGAKGAEAYQKVGDKIMVHIHDLKEAAQKGFSKT